VVSHSSVLEALRQVPQTRRHIAAYPGLGLDVNESTKTPLGEKLAEDETAPFGRVASESKGTHCKVPHISFEA